jgi:hypothetical protein
MIELTREAAEDFARSWIEEWNARNIDAVLERYAENCVFISSRASSFAHAPSLVGKAALRGYFEKALVGVPDLRFKLDHFLWDPTLPALVMVHVASVADKHIRECEIMYFNDDGKIMRDEAFYGGAS